ncbi:MAG: hypothetical protein ACRBG0_18600 [Lewinella sp.]|uniref:hypothetical protein n=1 Tax=Lewinella sp. TaxID=2004506 RepID=UPI003D6BAEEB
MKQVLFILIGLPLFLMAQENDKQHCYYIKFLDFYGVDSSQEVAIWSNDDISQFSHRLTDSYDVTNPNFLIPVIIAQLPSYHSNCNANIDTSTLDNLTRLYGLLSKTPFSKLLNADKDTQIDNVRNSFYHLVEKDSLVSEMLFTMDDGPFTGENISDSVILTGPIRTVQLPLGTLSIYEQLNKVILEYKGTSNRVTWRKAITYNDNEYLSDLFIPDEIITTSSLAIEVNIYLNKEKVSLFIRKTGGFMFYFYSW